MTHEDDGRENHRPHEADWEALALDELGELAWEPAPGNAFAPGSDHRKSWDDLILYPDLREAVERLNPSLPQTPSARPSPLPPLPRRRTRTRRTAPPTNT